MDLHVVALIAGFSCPFVFGYALTALKKKNRRRDGLARFDADVEHLKALIEIHEFPDLSPANLRGADLSGANISGADLRLVR
ncbi:MAG: pentapeptide repeat-containing protein [Shewanella sp.]|uniref:pentapeptide repeat-containing protein n=1 Tax=Aeromonas popoffii TaxID=70856 RepID=UPI003F315989